jgi:hypothetical protein
MTDKDILKMAEEGRQCLTRAVHDELVKKAKLGQNVIINRGGKPYKVSAAEALRVQEEGGEYNTKPASDQ